MKPIIFILVMAVLASFVYGITIDVNNFTYINSNASFTLASQENTTYYVILPSYAWQNNEPRIRIYTANATVLVNATDTFNRPDDTAIGNNWTQVLLPGNSRTINNHLQVNQSESADLSLRWKIRARYYTYMEFVFNCSDANSQNRLIFNIASETAGDYIRFGMCRANLFEVFNTTTFSWKPHVGISSYKNYKVQINFSVADDTIRVVLNTTTGKVWRVPGWGAPLQYVRFDSGFSNTKTRFDIDYINLTVLDRLQENMSLNITLADSKSFGKKNHTILNMNLTLDRTLMSNTALDCICNRCVESNEICYMPLTFVRNDTGTLKYYIDYIRKYNYSYGFDNCSSTINVPNATAYNISFYDSINNRENVGAIVDFKNSFLNYTNASYSQNETLICVYPYWLNVTGDLKIIYSQASGTTYEYNVINTSMDNVTDKLMLHTQTNTTLVLLTVQNIDGDPIEGAFIHVMKYDVTTGAYITTEILQTDSRGQTIANLVLYYSYYNFLIYYGGSLVYVENAVRVITTTRIFTVDFTTATWYDDFSTTLGVNTRLIFNDTTHNFVYTWSDPSGEMHYACLKVDKTNISGKHNLSDTCTLSASSTIIYNIPVLNNGTEYIGTGYLKFDNIIITDRKLKWLPIAEALGTDDKTLGLFLTFLLCLVMLMAGLPNPAIGFILMGVGLVVSMMFQWTLLTSMTLGTFIVFILIQLYLAGRQTE